MKFVTLITEPKDYSPKALDLYQSIGEVYELSEAEAVKKEGPKFNADILVLRLKYLIDKSWLDKLPNLKVIATPTTGLNHVDMAEAEKRGIKIISLRGHASFLDKITSTAEETVGLMIALVRKLPWAFEYVKQGGWVDRDRFRGRQLVGKTIGILGLGRLGKMVARYAQAMGMKVIAADPNISESAMKELGVEKVETDQLFKVSDIVSVHVLLTDETKNIFKEAHLKMMKPTAYLINTARAEIIEKGALEKALEERWIAGAAIDVMWGEEGGLGFEQVLKNEPLWQYAQSHDNLLIVPHIGGAAYEAMWATEEFIADLVRKAMK
ncbi:MAG: NAD(P)-dependent oxidoreductase [Patescibacteria group bacterium]